MQPTTKDLARAAGVSLATVDRVLNNRPNVSKKARDSVQRAIDEIEFVRNAAAVNLARSRTYRFQFLLPADGDEHLAELVRQVLHMRAAAKHDQTALEVAQVDMHDPHAIAAHLSALVPGTTDGVAIMAPESPQVRDAIARLAERGVQAVQFLTAQSGSDQTGSDQTGSEQEPAAVGYFVGADNFAAGATAARILGGFTRHREGAVLVVADNMHSADSVQRRFGFDKVTADFAHLTVLPSVETWGDEARADAIIGAVRRTHGDIVAVYVLASEARMAVALLHRHDLTDPVVVAHERTPFTTAALRDGTLDAVIAQDPGHAVRSAIRVMRAQAEGRKPLAAQERIRNEILLKENL